MLPTDAISKYDNYRVIIGTSTSTYLATTNSQLPTTNYQLPAIYYLHQPTPT
ncbi:hypothetical protein BofuT4_uP088620.1 [Botrytis cinerea T4]|uniref:Uncharacterized protein n=1 Tax=Botryotinia fuckeliana (strain T4) TaxID=999810 RepID=G2YGA1_BOTF4|nr:hypothetical protein BofuT4_uP088620.1 [Botrytis cinerea T4]